MTFAGKQADLEIIVLSKINYAQKHKCYMFTAWHTPLITAEAGRLLWVRGQPGLQSKFQDRKRYTEKACMWGMGVTCFLSYEGPHSKTIHTSIFFI